MITLFSWQEDDIVISTISCFTNYAAGLTDEYLTHHSVLGTANSMRNKFAEIIKVII